MTTESLAQSLWLARAKGTSIPKPNIDLSLVEAYQIQRDIVKLSGLKQLGWKVGSTSEAAQRKLGTSEPGAGPLLDSFCYQSGDRVPISGDYPVYLEGEFAFVIGRDMVFAKTPSHQQIAECIDAMIPGLEVVGSRYESGLNGSGRELITADGGANIAFVGGTEQRHWSFEELPAQPVELFVNTTLWAKGSGADALGHPLNVLAWLIAFCANNNMVLEQGQVVTTGTCTGLVPVSPGDQVIVNFPGLGVVEAYFVTQ